MERKHMRSDEYEKYQLLIIERALSFHNTSGLDKEDLIAQGNLIFCMAKKKYDPKRKVKFATYLYTALNNRLFSYVQNQQKHTNKREYNTPVNMPEIKQYPKSLVDFKTERLFSLLHSFVFLSKEAEYVISILMKSPGEILNAVENIAPKTIKSDLQTFLKKKGWKLTKIRETFNELKDVMNN
jgi:RNA polymerase sigma factor (sigma-70 family)